jgi:hypothetical protein
MGLKIIKCHLYSLLEKCRHQRSKIDLFRTFYFHFLNILSIPPLTYPWGS